MYSCPSKETCDVTTKSLSLYWLPPSVHLSILSFNNEACDVTSSIIFWIRPVKQAHFSVCYNRFQVKNRARDIWKNKTVTTENQCSKIVLLRGKPYKSMVTFLTKNFYPELLPNLEPQLLVAVITYLPWSFLNAFLIINSDLVPTFTISTVFIKLAFFDGPHFCWHWTASHHSWNPESLPSHNLYSTLDRNI